MMEPKNQIFLPTRLLLIVVLLIAPTVLFAHASEQSIVLLLPTELYIRGGVMSVVASIVVISLAPKRFVSGLFRSWPLTLPAPPHWLAEVTSLFSLALMLFVLVTGVMGPRDPLTNILPLTVWTGGWIIFLALVGLLGDLWRYLNPWMGLYRLILGRDASPILPLPSALSEWPAVVLFFGFALYYIVDIAPEDPHRLATIISLYWGATFLAMVLFGGEIWLRRGEAFSVLFHLMARVSFLGPWRRPAIGVPGWALLPKRPLSVSLGMFALLILGMGSFDGLKETFWWLGNLGINPLEFPGRSAVMRSSFLGFVAATLVLLVLFSVVIWAGDWLAHRADPAQSRIGFAKVFSSFAPALLPIALGYHISHFFISFLINGQYLLAVLGDPMALGMNLFGLAETRVTTGFLNTTSSVESIFQIQAAAVVIGHILSVLVSHSVAMTLYQTPRRAALSQLPVGIFMALYTLFGLWLLATPRGA